MFITFTSGKRDDEKGFSISYRTGNYFLRFFIYFIIVVFCDYILKTMKQNIELMESNLLVKREEYGDEDGLIGYGSMSPCTNRPMFIQHPQSKAGNISTPHWSFWYLNGLDCQWRIRTQAKWAIELTISFFWTEIKLVLI